MQRVITLISAAIVAVWSTPLHGGITGFTDAGEWQEAVGEFSTIDFTEYPAGTVITDQYADLGVQFPEGNDFIYHTSAFVNDGTGLHGNNLDLQITVEFDTPQLWFGVDHPGIAVIDAYANGELIESFGHGQGTFGAFTGILSDVYFDKVVIHRGNDNSAARIDDMHWGVPAPGAVAALALAGLLGGSRRRTH